MANCRLCGNMGWLFALTPNGLCDECERLVSMQIEQRERIIREEARGAESTVNPSSKLAHMDVQVENLAAMADLEGKGIRKAEGAASRLKKSLGDRDSLITRTARAELKEVLSAVHSTPDADAKLKLYSRLLLKLQDYEDRLTDKKPLAAVTGRVRGAMRRIRLNVRLEDAARAEQEGRTEEAARLYRDALAELKGLETDSPARARRIERLGARIAGLDRREEQ